MNRRQFLKAGALGTGLGALPAAAFAASDASSATASSAAPMVEYDGWIVELQDKTAVQAREIEVLRARVAELEPDSANDDRCAAVQDELEATREHLDAVLDSTSWKITEPLRAVVSIFR